VQNMPLSRQRLLDGITFLALLGFYVNQNLWRVVGTDYNWDLLNYHLNNATNSQPLVLHPAGIQSFFSPTLDRLILPIHTLIPAPFSGILMITPFVVNFYIVRNLFIGKLLQSHISLPNTIAAVSIMPSMAISQINNSMGDLLLTPIALLTIYLLAEGLRRNNLQYFGLSGLLFGVLLGLKLSYSYLVISALLVFLVYFFMKQTRLLSGLVWSFYGILGYLLLSLPHLLKLQRDFGNPFFPFFNKYFDSPNFDDINFRDERFGLNNVYDYVRVPTQLAFGEAAGTSELTFQDPRLLFIVGTLVIFIVVSAVRSLSGIALLRSREFLFLFLFMIFSYLVWGKFLGISRYFIPIEIIGVAWACSFFAREFSRIKARSFMVEIFLLSMVLIFTMTTSSVNWGHKKYSEKSVAFEKNVYKFSSKKRAAYLLVDAPLAFLKYQSMFNEKQLWFSPAFNSYDLEQQSRILRGRKIFTLSYQDNPKIIDEVLKRYDLEFGQGCKVIQLRFSNGLTPSQVFFCETRSISE
jgi:hypothetical protein